MSGELCVLCKNPVSEPVFQVTLDGTHTPRTFTLLRCDSCGLVMTAPRLEKAGLEPHYGPEYWGRVDADNLGWVRRDEAPRTRFSKGSAAKGVCSTWDAAWDYSCWRSIRRAGSATAWK